MFIGTCVSAAHPTLRAVQRRSDPLSSKDEYAAACPAQMEESLLLEQIECTSPPPPFLTQLWGAHDEPPTLVDRVSLRTLMSPNTDELSLEAAAPPPGSFLGAWVCFCLQPCPRRRTVQGLPASIMEVVVGQSGGWGTRE